MTSYIVGYPRTGPKWELKLAQESFWDGKSSAGDLQKVAADQRESIWKQMADTWITYTPFSCYDQAAALKGSDHRRATNVSARLDAQQKKLNFHLLPTSIIGSFPLTMELRKVRREYKAKKISEDDYVKAIEEKIREVVEFQEELGINVLVHGEPERNDMVEYFGKSSPRGQRCGGPKLFLIKETKGDRDEIDYTEDDLWHCLPEELKEYFGKSPPAISRSPIPKTMKVKIMVNSHEYIALIDTGSNHNFLQPWVAEEAGLEIIEEKPIEVCIADGSIMCSEGSCPEFKFVIQGCQFATQAYILQMGGCDVR